MTADEAAGAPAEVLALAQQRSQARAARDFAEADALRDRIAELGYVVTDTAEGFALVPRPPFEVHAGTAALLADLPPRDVARCTVGLVVDGWPEDLIACVESFLAYAPEDVVIVGLDCGDVSGAGRALHALAVAHPGRVVDLHVAGTLSQVGWAAAVTTLLQASTSELVAIADLSTVLDGDALSPMIAVLDDPKVSGSGWRGVNVDTADGWRSFTDAGAGEVDAVLGYLIVVRRAAGLATPPHPKARFYRNGDMEWSLAMRAAGGRLVIPDGDLPVHQERHRGYHDSDPEYRDRESRKTYDRLLQRFRGQDRILAPRA